MPDEIKPVSPAFPVTGRLYSLGEEPPHTRKHTRTSAPKAPRNEGYALDGITPEQAADLLNHPIFVHPEVLANAHMAQLKDALAKKKTGTTGLTDDVTLSTAQQAVDSLVSVTYRPGTAATPSDVLALVQEFSALAANVGQSKPIRLG